MRIAVDLTPLLPGAANGGLKLLAVELIRQLRHVAADCEFILLTAERTHEELAALDSPNVRRHCVAPSNSTTPESTSTRESLLRKLGVDVLFCPFMAPFYFDPVIPTVSIVADLQYLYYPEFFDPEECRERDEHFKGACQVAARLVCISDYVRETVLEKSSLDPDQVTTIHIERIDGDPGLAADMARRGHARLLAFSDPSEMARQYLRVFHEVLTSGWRFFTTSAAGVHQDGWLGERTVITYGATRDGEPARRHLELELTVPPYHPFDEVTVCVAGSGAGHPERQVIRRGATLAIRLELRPLGGIVEVVGETVFRPQAHGMGDDERLLSCLCRVCRIVGPQGVLDLLEERT